MIANVSPKSYNANTSYQMDKGVSFLKNTVVLRRCGASGKEYFINRVDDVIWPSYKDLSADVSSVSPSSERTISMAFALTKKGSLYEGQITFVNSEGGSFVKKNKTKQNIKKKHSLSISKYGPLDRLQMITL